MNSSFPPDPRFPSNLGPDPRGRETRTDPAGADDFRADLQSLRLALADVKGLLTIVDTHLCRLELAELTAEHRLNVVQEATTAQGLQLLDHEERLTRLENPDRTAAE